MWKSVVKMNVILRGLNVLVRVWLSVGCVGRMEGSVLCVRMGFNCKAVINVCRNVWEVIVQIISMFVLKIKWKIVWFVMMVGWNVCSVRKIYICMKMEVIVM